ncbi:MAG: Ig-like domain-containing protein [Candidatus Paceibacterota bacterium]|jgi:hypothetical protein
MQNKIARSLFLLALAGFGFVLFNAKDLSLANSTAVSDISVSVSPSSVYVGGMVEVAVSMIPGTVFSADSISVKLASPSASDYVLLKDVKKDSSGVWRGQITIPLEAELGTWKVYFVQATDAAGVVKNYYYDSINVNFSVVGPDGNGGGTVSSCDFVYSDWSECQNGLQTRTVLSTSPSGCNAGTAVLSQACSVCTITYSSWSNCVNGQQSRTIASKEPAGCVVSGLAPVMTRVCTVCNSWQYSDWGVCADGRQSRKILYSFPAGCVGGNPEILTRSCESSSCLDEWTCHAWGECVNGVQKRDCSISFDCLSSEDKAPEIEQACISSPTSTVPCQYGYSEWGVCDNGKQRRTIASKTPDGCVGTVDSAYLERYCTATTSSLPACVYTYGAWSDCSNGKKTRSVVSTYPEKCLSGNAITEAECEDLPDCTSEDWKCGEWSVCNSDRRQYRRCSLDSNCVSASAVKPALEQICVQPQASSTAGGAQASAIIPATGTTGEVQDESCVRAELKDQGDCQWYLYKFKIAEECLGKGLGDQNKCREYFLAKYGKPLKCQGMSDEKCDSLINEIILSDLKNVIVPEIRQTLAELSGNTAMADGENRTLAVNIGDKEGGTVSIREVKLEGMPLSRSGGRVAVSLLPTVATSQQETLSPVAIGFDSNGNGVPDDAEGRLGSLPSADRDSITKEQLSALSGIDQALIRGKSLEQPKFGNASSSGYLTVLSIGNAVSASGGDTGTLKFQGKALPGQVVTLFVYSPIPIVLTVKADQNGNWIYDLDKTLIDGTHEVYAVINDEEGRIVEASLPAPFFIQEAKAVTVNDFVKTQSAAAVPDQSANFITFYLLGGGAFILIIVVAFLLFRKRATE